MLICPFLYYAPAAVFIVLSRAVHIPSVEAKNWYTLHMCVHAYSTYHATLGWGYTLHSVPCVQYIPCHPRMGVHTPHVCTCVQYIPRHPRMGVHTPQCAVRTVHTMPPSVGYTLHMCARASSTQCFPQKDIATGCQGVQTIHCHLFYCILVFFMKEKMLGGGGYRVLLLCSITLLTIEFSASQRLFSSF